MTKQQRLFADLGFHDLQAYHLKNALTKLQAAQPEPEPEVAQPPKNKRKGKKQTPKGVTYDKENGKYRAYGPTIDFVQPYIGVFSTEEEAVAAREQYLIEETGKPNYP